MNLVKRNPLTTIVVVLTIISNIWSLVTENAELLSIGSRTIAIGTLILTAIMITYNTITNPDVDASGNFSARTVAPSIKAKQSPATIILTVITVLTNIWALATENAELLGIGAKALGIGSLILQVIVMSVNSALAQQE